MEQPAELRDEGTSEGPGGTQGWWARSWGPALPARAGLVCCSFPAVLPIQANEPLLSPQPPVLSASQVSAGQEDEEWGVTSIRAHIHSRERAQPGSGAGGGV